MNYVYICRLQEELYEQKERWDKQIVDVSRSQVHKDVEMQRLRESEEKLKAELIQRKQDIERYDDETLISYQLIARIILTHFI
jgi:hypothetical protein